MPPPSTLDSTFTAAWSRWLSGGARPPTRIWVCCAGCSMTLRRAAATGGAISASSAPESPPGIAPKSRCASASTSSTGTCPLTATTMRSGR